MILLDDEQTPAGQPSKLQNEQQPVTPRERLNTTVNTDNLEHSHASRAPHNLVSTTDPPPPPYSPPGHPSPCGEQSSLLPSPVISPSIQRKRSRRAAKRFCSALAVSLVIFVSCGMMFNSIISDLKRMRKNPRWNNAPKDTPQINPGFPETDSIVQCINLNDWSPSNPSSLSLTTLSSALRLPFSALSKSRRKSTKLKRKKYKSKISNDPLTPSSLPARLATPQALGPLHISTANFHLPPNASSIFFTSDGSVTGEIILTPDGTDDDDNDRVHVDVFRKSTVATEDLPETYICVLERGQGKVGVGLITPGHASTSPNEFVDYSFSIKLPASQSSWEDVTKNNSRHYNSLSFEAPFMFNVVSRLDGFVYFDEFNINTRNTSVYFETIHADRVNITVSNGEIQGSLRASSLVSLSNSQELMFVNVELYGGDAQKPTELYLANRDGSAQADVVLLPQRSCSLIPPPGHTLPLPSIPIYPIPTTQPSATTPTTLTAHRSFYSYPSYPLTETNPYSYSYLPTPPYGSSDSQNIVTGTALEEFELMAPKVTATTMPVEPPPSCATPAFSVRASADNSLTLNVFVPQPQLGYETTPPEPQPSITHSEANLHRTTLTPLLKLLATATTGTASLNLPPSFEGSYDVRGRYAVIIDDSPGDPSGEGRERQREEKQVQMESNKEDGRARGHDREKRPDIRVKPRPPHPNPLNYDHDINRVSGRVWWGDEMSEAARQSSARVEASRMAYLHFGE